MLKSFLDNSGLLVLGTAVALVWANLARDSYVEFSHAIHFIVNDIAMAFFFALAAKEVVEATAPGGALHSPRRAAMPLAAAIGGMVGPAAIFLWMTIAFDRPDLERGWAIPCATDIAFSYLVARLILGAAHPAIPFLLLLAIADDALGLAILALFYPAGPLRLVELAVVLEKRPHVTGVPGDFLENVPARVHQQLILGGTTPLLRIQTIDQRGDVLLAGGVVARAPDRVVEALLNVYDDQRDAVHLSDRLRLR